MDKIVWKKAVPLYFTIHNFSVNPSYNKQLTVDIFERSDYPATRDCLLQFKPPSCHTYRKSFTK